MKRRLLSDSPPSKKRHIESDEGVESSYDIASSSMSLASTATDEVESLSNIASSSMSLASTATDEAESLSNIASSSMSLKSTATDELAQYYEEAMPIDPSFMKRYFQACFENMENNALNIDFIKEHLQNYHPSSRHLSQECLKVSDFIKCTFSIKLKCINQSFIYQGIFEQLKTTYGHNIIAHGVEEAKGGLSNILLMYITGKVFSPNYHWGALVDGSPSNSPVSHGPYFLIASTQGAKPPHHPDVKRILYILVPFKIIKERFLNRASALNETSLLSDEASQMIHHKTKTYDEFMSLLEQNKIDPTIEENAIIAEQARKNALDQERIELRFRRRGREIRKVTQSLQNDKIKRKLFPFS